jgi:hypothetical protein
MTQPLELDPVAIGQSLTAQREQSALWDEAWLIATNHRRPSIDERSLYTFMERNFKAAYYDDASEKGRCRVDERDVSGAIVKGLLRVPVVRTGDGVCRSGDDCSRPATHGRFGPTFCESHHAELQRIAVKMAGGLRYLGIRAA